MVIEVPRLKGVATNVKPNIQDHLNAVTEILSRISKLVSDDLDKAVSSTEGHDKEGSQSLEKAYLHFKSKSDFFFLKLHTVLQVLLRIRGQF